MLNSVALFLLECPPLEEIGGPVTEIIEKYRNGMVSEKEASDILTTKFKSFLTKYLEQQQEIEQLELQYEL